MLTNFLKIGYRHLIKNSVFSFINVVGLAIGIACSALIMLWVADELSYDRIHANYDDIYQVYRNIELDDHIATDASEPYPLKEALRTASSQIKSVAMSNWGEGNLLTVGETRINKQGFAVTPEYLEIFTLPFIAGDPIHALDEPRSIVINRSTAVALFGDKDPLNQYIRMENKDELKVTGVFEDLPAQTTFRRDYLLSFAYFESISPWVRNSKDRWDNNSLQIFVQLQSGVKRESVTPAIHGLILKNLKQEPKSTLFLHPMSQWRLYSRFENGKAAGGLIDYVRLFTVIAAFVLVIACINFMNLATARSESRAREVGIRKSIGSRRKELVLQFLGESILVTTIAFLLAMLMVELSLPLYNLLVDKHLELNYSDPMIWVGAIATITVTGLVAGSYPAFYLSSFRPAEVLKGKSARGSKGILPRQVLVVVQFGFSILLIIGTTVMYKQIQHTKNRDLGYDRENLMMIWTTGDIEKNFTTFKEELKRTGVVKAACKSNSPITRIFSTNVPEWEGMTPGTNISFTTIATEYDYAETMGIKLVSGRDFSPDFKSDSTALLVNQAAVSIMGLKEPLGAKVKMWGIDFHIIGVMPDIIMDSPYHPVEPLLMMFQPTWSSTISVRLEKTDDLPASIAEVEKVFKKFNPDFPFEYRFADTEFSKKFASIHLISRLSGIFSTLAIAITCLGLFGLAAFTTEQRTKEIGIRKVMGASIPNLVGLISKDFSRLVLIAFLISAPLAWWFLNRFLERYPYRTEIQWWILPAAGIFAMAITLMIVASQAIKAARKNPAISLRTE